MVSVGYRTGVLNGKKKSDPVSQKGPRAFHVLNHGWWQLAVGSWRQLAVGSWQLAVGGGWWWLAAVGGWRLVVGGSWQWLAVGGWSPLAVGAGWWLAVGGGWRLAVGGPLGLSLRALLSKNKKSRPLRTPLGTGWQPCRAGPCTFGSLGGCPRECGPPSPPAPASVAPRWQSQLTALLHSPPAPVNPVQPQRGTASAAPRPSPLLHPRLRPSVLLPRLLLVLHLPLRPTFLELFDPCDELLALGLQRPHRVLARGGRPLGSGRQLPPPLLTVGRRPLWGGGGDLRGGFREGEGGGV